MVKYIVAIILFGVIILFHEWGHFLLAKANGIRVNEFCLGLGPTIVGFYKRRDEIFPEAVSHRGSLHHGRGG